MAKFLQGKMCDCVLTICRQRVTVGVFCVSPHVAVVCFCQFGVSAYLRMYLRRLRI